MTVSDSVLVLVDSFEHDVRSGDDRALEERGCAREKLCCESVLIAAGLCVRVNKMASVALSPTSPSTAGAGLPASPVREKKLALGLPWPGEIQAGQLYTWGRGSDGQLGQDRVKHPLGDNCAIPYPVPGMTNVIWVACGGGQQGCTACVTDVGEVYTFGNNYGYRLGQSGLKTEREHVRTPQLVQSLSHDRMVQVECGAKHMLALSRQGSVYSWGTNVAGCLGIGSRDVALVRRDATLVTMPSSVLWVSCEADYSGCVTQAGELYMFGSNLWGGGVGGRTGEKWRGKLGLGDEGGRCQTTPQRVVSLHGAFVTRLSLGSVYAGCCTEDGALFMWGYGGHGNLGLGNRRSYSTPQLVTSLADKGEHVVDIACTVGQEGPKGDFYPTTKGGNEGPHTIVVTQTGGLFTFGTCHKGLLANFGAKTGGFGEPYDELLPYNVGKDALRNAGKKGKPISPFAAWPPPYDEAMGHKVVHAVSAHIHCALLTENGDAWAWGCGSNDGRCGVERFLNKNGEGKPPAVDAMKCYMMQPHRIGHARPPYWKHGGGLTHARIRLLATGRNHMAAVGSGGTREEGKKT